MSSGPNRAAAWTGDRWEVSPDDVRSALDDLVLVDCRTDQERGIACIEPSRHVPLDAFLDSMEDLVNTDRPIVVYCHHGQRSMMATNALRSAGKADAWSMHGGIDRWSCEIAPEIPRY
ncbi:MAG: rhodanese-like domain-containing protein [Planctomycetota bacterium]|jgi:adenylyltransferase/sulfurtransferase